MLLLLLLITQSAGWLSPTIKVPDQEENICPLPGQMTSGSSLSLL